LDFAAASKPRNPHAIDNLKQVRPDAEGGFDTSGEWISDLPDVTQRRSDFQYRSWLMLPQIGYMVPVSFVSIGKKPTAGALNRLPNAPCRASVEPPPSTFEGDMRKT